MKIQVALFSDNSEKVCYDNRQLPVYIRCGRLSYYPDYAAVSHWHNDFEFIYILSGKMDFRVEDKVYTLHPGEGLCINSRQVHYGFSKKHEECEFLCILLHPMLLCGNGWTEEKLVAPLINNSNYPCQCLFPDTDWQKRIIDELQKIYDVRDLPSMPLLVQGSFFNIIAELSEHQPEVEQSRPENSNLRSLQLMIGYIQKHYAEKITLSDIASAGNVCRSRCCGIFQTCLHQTPISHLIHYRLEKSMDLLCNSDLSINEISDRVGFFSASYFTKMFRQWNLCSPSDFRMKNKKATPQKTEPPIRKQIRRRVFRNA